MKNELQRAIKKYGECYRMFNVVVTVEEGFNPSEEELNSVEIKTEYLDKVKFNWFDREITLWQVLNCYDDFESPTILSLINAYWPLKAFYDLFIAKDEEEKKDFLIDVINYTEGYPEEEESRETIFLNDLYGLAS